MMALFQSLAEALENLGTLTYLITFLIVYVESLVVIGQFFPGTIYLALVGFLCYLGVFSIEKMVLVTFLAHYAGELTNYFFGRTRGRALFNAQNKYLTPALLDRVEQGFIRRGAGLIITGQFLGFLRAAVSFVAGVIHYPLARFLVVTALADLLWSVFHLGIGLVFGASWQRSAHLIERLSLALVIVIFTAWFSGWLVRLLLAHTGEASGLMERLSRRVRTSARYERLALRHPRLFAFFEARLNQSAPWGLHATLGLMMTLLWGLLFINLLRGVHQRPGWGLFDVSTLNLFAQLRQPAADWLFYWLRDLGSWPVLLGMALLAAGACLYARQYKSLVIIAGSFALVTALAWTLNLADVGGATRALLSLAPARRDAFPSAPTGSVATLYVSLYLWLWNHPGRRRLRAGLAMLVVTLILLIGAARIYLGLQYISDALGGLFLGLACVVFVTTLTHQFERLPEGGRRADGAALVILLTAMGLAGVLAGRWPRPSPPPAVPPPVRVARLDAVLPLLPRAACDLTGRPTLPVSVILVGGAERLAIALEARGWRRVAPDAFLTRPIESPLFPAFVQGRPAPLTLEERRGEERLVLRLWPMACRVGERPVWLGGVSREVVSPHWLGVRRFATTPDLDLATERFAAAAAPHAAVTWIPFRARDLYDWRHPFFTHGAAAVLTLPADRLF